MNNALLDTDILSEVGKGVDPTVARHAIAYRKLHGRLTLSAISVMEVIKGYQRAGASSRIRGFRGAIVAEEVLPFDQAAADLAGRIAGDLDRVGQPIGRRDPMIAAIAIQTGLELITGNTNHYARLGPLGYPITLVNWRL